nr:MAG TPA: Exonuclease [Caudoviricetes sp.]
MCSKLNMLCKEYRENRRMLKELEALQDNIKLEIISLMGDNEIVIDGADKVTYKAVQSSRFDSNSFKKSYPDLYTKYCVSSEYKRFSIV